MDIAIVGGGAAGFFLAVELKRKLPAAHVTLFERKRTVLAKVLVTGGGRCNVTNSFRDTGDLKHVYPRGHKLLKGLFKVFSPADTFRWFEENGTPLVIQDDQCVFPRSQDAHSIAGCLTAAAATAGVVVKTGHTLRDITPVDGGFRLHFAEPAGAGETVFRFVAVTTGGSPRSEGLDYLRRLGHAIETPVPSLFSFNLPGSAVTGLMGTVVEGVETALPGTPFRSRGALLVTHWGMSGPAILKLSSHAARHLNACGYRCKLAVNWAGTDNGRVAEALQQTAAVHAPKRVANVRLFDLPARLWEFLLTRAGIAADRRWGELGRKGMNRLAEHLCNDLYDMDGRSTHREEFVTCGGVSLDAVNRHTLESKVCQGLYFAGEVLDIDGITGGFNLQAAWTTGYAVAQAIGKKAMETAAETH